ncbi:MAG: cytidine deaminase [Caldisericia bacterium]|jgi:cytidine deaminase|nr:cytidine deaminase [Caldisericia bacterium]
MKLTKRLIQKMVNIAKEASEKAYSPYSGYKVGASLLTKNGKIFTGCNIENASFGATICAERVAIFKAISEGEKDFEIIAVYVNDKKNIPSPCGICRQVMMEFSPDLKLILSNGDEYKIYKLEELLPYPFSKNFL